MTPASAGVPRETTAPTVRAACPGALRKSGPGPKSLRMMIRRGNPGGGRKSGCGGGGPNSNIPTDRWLVSASRSSSWLVKKRCSASSVPTPIAAHTKASRTICVASSRTRSDHVRGERMRLRPASACGLEDISGTAQRMDHRLASAVDLLAQIGDVELDDVGSATEVVAPHAVKNLRLAQHTFGIAHHEPQQLEFGSGQRDEVAAAGDLVAVLVEHQIADDDLGPAGFAGHPGTPQQRT